MGAELHAMCICLVIRYRFKYFKGIPNNPFFNNSTVAMRISEGWYLLKRWDIIEKFSIIAAK